MVGSPLSNLSPRSFHDTKIPPKRQNGTDVSRSRDALTRNNRTAIRDPTRPTARFRGPVGILPHKRPTGTTCRPERARPPCESPEFRTSLSSFSSPSSVCDGVLRARRRVPVRASSVCPRTLSRERKGRPARVTPRYLFLGTGAISISEGGDQLHLLASPRERASNEKRRCKAITGTSSFTCNRDKKRDAFARVSIPKTLRRSQPNAIFSGQLTAF